ncbi:MAG: hypothetical protein ACK4GN_02650 [Runella sp.]
MIQQTLYSVSCEGLPSLSKHSHIFKGDEASPLLAPRGVWLLADRLIVSDTGQNRVFVWNSLSEHTFAAPDVVLGQTETTDTGRNAGHEATARTLQYPSGVWSDGQRLIVADAWNHRVLIWHQFPTQHGQLADVVVGQPTFHHNQPNVEGIGATPTAHSLNWPYGVFSDGVGLWIADTGNRRVLFYAQIPTQNFTPADSVIGKPDFYTRDYENHEPIWPYSVRVSAQGQMLIADTQYYRCLLWYHWQDALTRPADIIIGQPHFEANGMNQFDLYPKQNSLSWTYDAVFYKNGIFVADTGNSRILWFESLPTQNAALATNLIGQKKFNVGSENPNTRYGTELQLYWPFSISVCNNTLAVADTGNHRIIFYHL